jgi:hypothetical protein
MAKKTNPEEDRIFKPPESPHFQTAADTPCLNGTKMKYIQVVSAGKGWDLRNLWDELLTLFGKRPFQGLPLVDNGAAFGSRTLLLQHADPYYSETDPIFGAFGRSQEAFGDRARGFSSLLTFEVCRVCLCN